jgi:hypothetical protein
MTDFHLWGSVTQLAPREFVVIVSAVSDGEAYVEQEVTDSRESAVLRQRDMAFKLVVKVMSNGGRIVDTEYAE